MQSHADFETFFQTLLNSDRFKEKPKELIQYLRELETNLAEQEKILQQLCRLELGLLRAGVKLDQVPEQEKGEVSLNEIKHLRVVLFRQQVQEKLLIVELNSLVKSVLHPLDLKKQEDFLRKLSTEDIEFLWKKEKELERLIFVLKQMCEWEKEKISSPALKAYQFLHIVVIDLHIKLLEHKASILREPGQYWVWDAWDTLFSRKKSKPAEDEKRPIMELEEARRPSLS